MNKKFRVPKSAITEKGLKKLILEAVGTDGSKSDWATANGITPQQLSAFFCKKQGAGLKIPEALGYRPEVVFVPVEEDRISTMNPPRREAKHPTTKVDHTKDPVTRKGLKPKDDRKETKKKLKKRNKKK